MEHELKGLERDLAALEAKLFQLPKESFENVPKELNEVSDKVFNMLRDVRRIIDRDEGRG